MRATAAATGRPGDDPGDRLRLELSGSLHRLRSRRRLETEAARHLELMWLLGTRRPDVKPIADCRRGNGTALKRVGRACTLLGKALDLCGGERSAMDGSTCQAVNGPERHFSGSQRGRVIAESDAKIAAYLQQLDSHEAEEPPLRPPPAAQLQQKLAPWQERQQRDQRDQPPLPQSGATHISLTAPDRRTIRRGARRLVGDNGPVAVAEQDKRIVAHEVTQAVTAQPPPVPIAERATPT